MQEIECKGVFSITRHRKIKNKTPKQNKLTQAVAGTSRQHQRPSSCVVPGEKANAATVSQHAVSTRCSTQLEKWKQSPCPCRSASLHQWRWFQLLLLPSSLVYTQWSLIQFTKGLSLLLLMQRWSKTEELDWDQTGWLDDAFISVSDRGTQPAWSRSHVTGDVRGAERAWVHERRQGRAEMWLKGRPSRGQEEGQRKEDRTDSAPFSGLTQAGRQDMS